MEPAIGASWIGPLVALGGRASRYLKKLGAHRQLIVTLSVPQRDFAAVLIGCGWVMNSAPPEFHEPVEVLRELESDTPIRMVTDRYVIADRFRSLDETKQPEVRLSRWQWLVSGIRAVKVLEQELEKPVRTARPKPGTAARIAQLEDTWEVRLADPAADLAIVGTLKWLLEDLAAYLTREGEQLAPDLLPGAEGRLAHLLLPKDEKCATWFTRLYASTRLPDHLPLPHDLSAVILDGAGAIKHVAEVEAPVVICILDRSVADETAADMVVQLRNSRGEPLSLQDDLAWCPPAGIEVLAFTVAL